jgi:hypothetical protein
MYKFRILFDGNLYCSHRREIKESWAFFSLRSSDNIQSSCLLLKSFSPLENTREREASLDYRRKEIKPQVGEIGNDCLHLALLHSLNLENDKKGKYLSRLQLYCLFIEWTIQEPT